MGQPARFENVLVGVDGTSTGRDAITLANRLGAGPGRLTLAHVIVVDVAAAVGRTCLEGSARDARAPERGDRRDR